jgi:hypothetical protein
MSDECLKAKRGDEIPLDPRFDVLLTGKQHISFSELRNWAECSWRHKLFFVKKIGVNEPSPYLDFGTAIHASCEKFLKTRVIDVPLAMEILINAWKEHGAAGVKGFEPEMLEKYLDEAEGILEDLPEYFDKTFPGWEYVDAEHALYEQILTKPYAFKGFIDGIIRVPGKRGKFVYWLIDWKSSSRGWFKEKRMDKLTHAQLILYKNYWTAKMSDINPKDVKCGFVILVRSAKPGKHCNLFKLSVGAVSTERALKIVTNMVTAIGKGIAVKNRYSCTYCQYKDTEFCK